MASSRVSRSEDSDDTAWAVWVSDGRNRRCVAVTASDEDEARQQALDETDDYDEVSGVDGPFEGCEPAVYEFTYHTEHVERVVVEAPAKDYAEECADAEREYRGEYKRTVHTETRRVEKETNDDEGEQNASLDSFTEGDDGE